MVKAVYKNSYEEYQKFGTFHTFWGRKKQILSFSIAFLTISVAFFVLAFIGYINFMPAAIASFLLVFLMPLFRRLMLYLRIRKIVKGNPNFAKTQNSYTFNEDGFDLKIESGKRAEDHNMKYAAMYMIYENKTNFYFYLNAASALIVPKAGIEEGSADALAEILQKGASGKFKSFVKRNG